VIVKLNNGARDGARTRDNRNHNPSFLRHSSIMQGISGLAQKGLDQNSYL